MLAFLSHLLICILYIRYFEIQEVLSFKYYKKHIRDSSHIITSFAYERDKEKNNYGKYLRRLTNYDTKKYTRKQTFLIFFIFCAD